MQKDSYRVSKPMPRELESIRELGRHREEDRRRVHHRAGKQFQQVLRVRSCTAFESIKLLI
jgi:hypothetical protein